MPHKKTMTVPLDISVVIATYNRADILQGTLQSLARQTIPAERFEVVVVDDGSTDTTSKMLSREALSLPYRLRAFRHENRGPGFTQNRGIRESAANLVQLLPDDVRPAPECLAHHLAHHAAHPTPEIAVLGRVLQSPELPPTVMHRYWEPFDQVFNRCRGKQEIDSLLFCACNVSVKRSFLLEHGLFRERRGAAAEDIELGYRLGRQGLRILFNPAALALHYHPVTLDWVCRRAFQTGCNFDLVSDQVPKEVIYPFYRIARWEAGLPGLLKMLPRMIIRGSTFNHTTVNFFWLPVLRRAEQSRIAALFACRKSYRGVVGYFFRRGLSAGPRAGDDGIGIPPGLNKA